MSIADVTAQVRQKVSGGGIDETVKFDCGADGVILVSGEAVANEDGAAECVISIGLEDLEALLAGDLSPTEGFMSGKLKVAGDMNVAMKLGSII